MTLHEIEQTLHTLQSRHVGLNEELLVTLLRGGGWEEKNIQEAIFLFRSGTSNVNSNPKEIEEKPMAGALPSVQMEPVLMPQADEKHLLLDHNEETPPHEPAEETVPELQSLVQPASETVFSKKEDFPHNLPLRPFETSEHIWPFSRYRDVFYGDMESEASKEEEKKVDAPAVKESPKEEAKAGLEKKEGIKEERPRTETLRTEMPPREPVVEKEIIPVPLTKGDEKLVILACVMLLVVLLLLGYMYSNGRL